MILALVASSQPSLSWGWPVAASFGGIIVLFGLWLEYSTEKPWYPNLDDLRWQNSKKKLGEKFVMFGILMEIGIGFAVAAKDELVERQTAEQIAQTSTNVAKADPLNQPIASVTALVSLATAGTNDVNTNGILFPGNVFLQLRHFEQKTSGIDAQRHILLCSDWFRFSPNWWSLKFNQWPATFFAPNSIVRNAKEWDAISIKTSFLHRDTEIAGGVVVLTVNSTTIQFPILPQKVKGNEDWINFDNNPYPGVFVFGK